MQLIESYLYEVGRYLPEAQRDDILVELRSSLEEEVRETAGTDEPTRNQVEMVLNKFGHPINVASAYKEPRYLIGPELYPAFIDTLSTLVTISLVVAISLQLLAWVTLGSVTSLKGLTENTVELGFWLVSITVIVFALLEYYGEHAGWYDNWKASSLSLDPPAPFNRSDILTNLVTEGVFLLWWNSVLVLQNWIPGLTDKTVISLSPVWQPLFWPVNIIVGSWFAVHAFTLFRRRWTRPALSAEILLGAVAIGLCIYLVLQPSLISVVGGLEGKDLLERSVRVTIGIVAVIIVWDWWQAVKKWK